MKTENGDDKKREALNKKCKLSTSKDVYDLLYKRVRKLDREHFFVIPLNAKNQVIGINLVSMGSLTSSVVHPREVFKPAILVSAASIILAHNHPSGDPMPSREDKEITIRLQQVGDILGIKVVDHIIFGEDKAYYSFLESKGINAEMPQNNAVSTIAAPECRISLPLIEGMEISTAERYMELRNEIDTKLCRIMDLSEILSRYAENDDVHISGCSDVIKEIAEDIYGRLDGFIGSSGVHLMLKEYKEKAENPTKGKS